MAETLCILCLLFLATLVVTVVLLAKVQGVTGRQDVQRERLKQAEGRLDALERRTDWLAQDTDDRLSRRKIGIQMLQMRAKTMARRIRRCEKELDINVKDNEEDGN